MTDTAPDYLAMTDFRALCAELLEIIDFLCEGDSRPDCDIVARARAYLAQPEPEGLTDEELEKLADNYMFMDGADGTMHLQHIDFARASVAADRARWGRPTTATETP